MKYTIKTSRGPVRFHSVGEPIAGIRADNGNPANDGGYSLAWKLDYAKSKIALLPAFGDSIGKDVSKAELALVNQYLTGASETVADLLATLEGIKTTLKAASMGYMPKELLLFTLDRLSNDAHESIAKAKGAA